MTQWGVDVTIAGTQKGLMAPPGLSFTAISEKALAAARGGGAARSYWDWAPLVTANQTGFFPYTPAINLLFALNEALAMLAEEGLPDGLRPPRALCASDPAAPPPPGGWSCNARTPPPMRRA